MCMVSLSKMVLFKMCPNILWNQLDITSQMVWCFNRCVNTMLFLPGKGHRYVSLKTQAGHEENAVFYAEIIEGTLVPILGMKQCNFSSAAITTHGSFLIYMFTLIT